MSGRVRNKSDCPVGKQGPMRATLPVSSVMKQSGGLKKSTANSPTLSPTNVWRRISPDHALSGQRSPGAINYKGKGRFGASVIRRTASLDTLYHKGQWSRDYYLHAGQLQVDKSTQEDENASFLYGIIQLVGWPKSNPTYKLLLKPLQNSLTDEGGGASGRSSRGSDDDKLDRFLRSRLQRPHKPATSGDSAHSMSPGFWSRFGSGGVPLRAARSSVEGLNQEIERLVLHPASGTQTPHLDRLKDKVTPEGHRAPLAELLRRSVNTQTPHDLCHTAHSSDPPSRGSLRSLSSSGSAELLAAGGSVCSSPDLDGAKLGTSPQINRFLAREPPDGCEKVNLKGCETLSAPEPVPLVAVPGFTLRPSLRSAFQPLQPAPPEPDQSAPRH